jgi:hypothetical protein
MKKNATTATFIFIFFLTANLIVYGQAKTQMRYTKDYYKLLRTQVCRKCDLYKAPLANIDLSGADLSGSNLFQADLRQATLINAKITGANFKNALLSGAVWIDGKVCKPGSVGQCITQ